MWGQRSEANDSGRRSLDRLRLVADRAHDDAARDDADARQPGDRIRRGSLSELPPPPSTDLVDRRLAEEIDYARRMLVAMGEGLAVDAGVVARHGAALQGFDVLAQTLGHLGSVVGAADREAAIARIGMADLRARMTRRALSEDGFARLS